MIPLSNEIRRVLISIWWGFCCNCVQTVRFWRDVKQEGLGNPGQNKLMDGHAAEKNNALIISCAYLRHVDFIGFLVLNWCWSHPWTLRYATSRIHNTKWNINNFASLGFFSLLDSFPKPPTSYRGRTRKDHELSRENDKTSSDKCHSRPYTKKAHKFLITQALETASL